MASVAIFAANCEADRCSCEHCVELDRAFPREGYQLCLLRSSGDLPDAIPLTESEAPAVAPARVRKPKAAQSESALAAAIAGGTPAMTAMSMIEKTPTKRGRKLPPAEPATEIPAATVPAAIGVIIPSASRIFPLHQLARAPENCDAAGRHDLYGLQLQAARAIVEGGGAVVRRRWRCRSDGLPLPFQLQVLEADYIDPSKTGPLPSAPGVVGGYSIYGIQFSPLGQREGYWLYNSHPGGLSIERLGSTFVQAADVAHIFRADRPEQEHGATWLAPVILRMRDFADYEDAELTRQKLASAFVGVVTGDDPDGPTNGISATMFAIRRLMSSNRAPRSSRATFGLIRA